MLTRLKFRRDFRPVLRSFSDKPSDNDPKPPATEKKVAAKPKETNENYTEKIQELLKVMMNPPKTQQSEFEFTRAPEKKKRVKAEDEIEVKVEKIEESLTKAAGEVAHAIGGDVKQTEAELLSKVLGKINQTSTSLSDLLVGMKVDRTRDNDDQRQGSKPESRGQQVRRLADKSRAEARPVRYTQRRTQEEGGRQSVSRSMVAPMTVDVFSGEPLGIFQNKQSNQGPKLEVWESLKQREVMLATSQPPANYFEKMIQWTEQGKIWKFPIDNEQGMEEEQSVHFSEHIFLDAHLEGWCPKKGPIRHFMELVCVGLSKNAFYTVKEKKDHIIWYKEYFESKKDLLLEVGAWDNASTKEQAST